MAHEDDEDDEDDAALEAELARVGVTRSAAAAVLHATVRYNWLIPHDLPTRALRALPEGAGPEAFAAQLWADLGPEARRGPGPSAPGA